MLLNRKWRLRWMYDALRWMHDAYIFPSSHPTINHPGSAGDNGIKEDPRYDAKCGMRRTKSTFQKIKDQDHYLSTT